MGYLLIIKVDENGTPEIDTFSSGEHTIIPSGRFIISGQSDKWAESVQVDRRDNHGRFAVAAQHSHSKSIHGPTPSDAPPPATGPDKASDGTLPPHGSSQWERGKLDPKTPPV